MAQYQLVMHTGPTPGKTFPLDGDVLTIGREASNAVAINDAEVSRKHTQLVFQGGKYIITDLGSTNGTFVNGQRVTGQHVLQPGEIVSLGEQISLLYEVVAQVDPNATMISSAVRMPVAPVPAAAAPPPSQPRAPQYSGQIPASPEPEAAYYPPPAKKKGLPIPLIIVGIVFFCLICSCAGFLYWVDSTAAWCQWFPFLFGGACG
ncbi:MAG: FHA domain-containing protein [Anaerolineales bacterium]|jgi:pSer/pThr/pTyr-binding forkhead associated (FHA) protein|nr:FHA domain-containing protein [Anaerolineales bacterium]